MTLYLETMTISPFAKIENILARSPFSEFMPCPRCGELVRYRYGSHDNDSSPKMIIECPDCGASSVIHGKFENGISTHKVLETGSEYNIQMRVDAVKAKLNGLGDGCTLCERARLTAELAWESKVLGDPLSRTWSESVDLFRDAISAGEDVRSDLTEAILRFLPMTGKEVRDTTARAAKMLIGCSDTPSTARECAVWLWYVRHDIDSPEPETELEDDLETWDIAKDAFLAMFDEEKKNAPRLPSLMDLWESDLADYMDDPDGLGADDRCSILIRSAMEKLFDSLESGVPLDPAHFDLLLFNVELMTTIEGSEDVLDLLLEHKGLFGGYADIVESFAELVRIQMDLCGNALAFDLLLSGIQNEPKREQVLAIEDVLKSLEGHVSLEYAGRTMIQAYLLYGFMIRESGCILYAEKCAQNLSYRHQDYGGFYHDIYVFAERQGFHNSEDDRSSRRTSRKDRVKKNKDIRRAHAERRRAEGGSRR